MYTSITEHNHESIKAKMELIKMLLMINWNMKITKIFCSIDHIEDIKWTKFKAKIIIWDCIELINILCLLAIIKTLYLKVDVVGYQVFINLLVNHKK